MSYGLKSCFTVAVLIGVLQWTLINTSAIWVSSTAHLPIHNLDTGLDYATIQEAIDALETLDGHMIRVDAGTYVEHVFVNKTLSIVGEGSNTTIIRGETQPDPIVTVFYIVADNVTIDGFTIRDGLCGAGIVANYTRIVHCSILNNVDGIVTAYSYGDNIIAENMIKDNTVSGIILNTNHDTIRDNTIANNGIGIYLADMIPPTLGRTSGCIIVRNNITYNGVGCSFYQTDNNVVTENYIAHNNIGCQPYFSNNNSISHNDFVDNKVHASSPNCTNLWDSDYPPRGNYWDDYDGVDIDQDGIGDSVYAIDENNQDNYPLMKKFNQEASAIAPEFPSTLVFLVTLALAATIMFLARKIKPPRNRNCEA